MSQASDPTPTPSPRPKGGLYAAFVAAGILLSRIAGLIRERVFAYYLGSSPAAGAFKAGLRIPNVLQNLLGEGVLSASFIPVYARLLARGDQALAGKVAGIILGLLSLVVGLFVLLGVFLTPTLVSLIVPGYDGEVRELAIQIVQILFPATGLLVLSAWCLGVLSSHKKFFLSYVAPVLWNAAMIGTLLLFGGKLSQPSLAVALAWGTVLGSLLQLLVQVPFVLKNAKGLSIGLSLALEPVREVLKNFVPVVLSRGVVQVSAYIDQIIASLLGPSLVAASAVAALSYAQTLYLLPISLFGMSVAVVELTEMSGALGSETQGALSEEAKNVLRTRLAAGLRRIAFFVIPSTIAFILLGQVLVAALYQTGRFGAEDTRFVWYILASASIGLMAATQGRLYSSAFYSLQDAKTPLRYSILRMILTGLIGALFAFPLRPYLLAALELLGAPLPKLEGIEFAIGAVSLTAGSALVGWLELSLLRRSLHQKIGAVPSQLSYQMKLWVSALLAGGLSLLAFWYLVPVLLAWWPALPAKHIVVAIVVSGLFGVLYFLFAAVFGISEVKSLLRRILRRR